MNVRKSYPPRDLSSEVIGEIERVLQLWAQARARFGGTGDFLFGDWCAADMMFAPLVTRFITYGVPMPPFAGLYMKAVLSHPHVAEWIDKAQDEPWVIDAYEADGAAAYQRSRNFGLGAAISSGRVTSQPACRRTAAVSSCMSRAIVRAWIPR